MTIRMKRMEEEGKTDVQAIEKLIKTIQADKKPAPVVSIEEFTGRKSNP